MSPKSEQTTIGSLLLMIIFSISIATCNAHAHSPHDVITSIAVSPFYENDRTVFIYVFDELKRSADGGGSWKNLVNGLDNNALISDIVVSKWGDREYNAYVSTRGDGIYRSMDGGDSWQPVNNGLSDLDIRLLAVSKDLLGGGTLVAVPQGNGLFVSTDAGESWMQAAADQFLATSVDIIQIGGRPRLLVGTDQGDIYLSDESLRQWVKQGQIAGAGMITALSAGRASADKALFFVGTEQNGLYETGDLGNSFRHVSLHSEDQAQQHGEHVTSIQTQGEGTQTKYFVSLWHEAVYVSSDGGQWTLMKKGLGKDRQADEFGEPHFYEVVLPPGYSSHGEAFIAGFDGLYKSAEYCRSWIEMETRQARNIEGLAISPNFANDHILAMATYDGGAYFSKDSGKTWQPNNFGLKTTHMWDVATKKGIDDNVEIFMINNRSFLNFQGLSEPCTRIEIGGSPFWQFAIAHFDEGSFMMKVARRVLERPKQRFPTTIAISPSYESDRTVFLGTRYRGVLKSTDAGVTWSRTLSDGKIWIASCRVSPAFETDGIVVTSVRRKGVYISSDRGETWQSRNKGLAARALQYENLGSWVLEFSPAYAEDHRLFCGTADGIYLTTDNGENWRRLPVSADERCEHIRAIGLSPDFEDDGTLLVSLKGHGLFRSTNGGRSFSAVAPELIQQSHLFKKILFSPDFSRDRTIVAASAEEAFLSKDGGARWASLERPVRYENTKHNIIYSKGWRTISHDCFSATNMHLTNIPGSTANFHFMGSRVTWYGPMDKSFGMADVYIDGAWAARVDQFNSDSKPFEAVYVLDKLSPGFHRLSIKVLDEKNKQATDRQIAIDAFDVY